MMEKCILCNSEQLERLKTTKQEVYVTGDRKSFDIGSKKIGKVICKDCGTVQFLQNTDHCAAVEEVFRDYGVIHMKTWSFDKEKKQEHKPQLQAEYERISAAVCLPKTGKMIDIGCGGGEALFQFHRICPEWELYGMDIGEQFREEVSQKAGVKKFFSSLEELKQSKLEFDFITINHMLCLANNPIQILETVHNILAEQGIFFLVDTDYEVHPWLLYDIENSCFFARDHLKKMLRGFGFEILDIEYEYEEKEIGIFSKKSNVRQPLCFDLYRRNKEIYEQKVDYLDGIIDTVREYLMKRDHIGIFGTSIAGVWLSEIITKCDVECAGKDIFYIEEDEEILKWGTGVNGYLICRLEDVTDDAVIFLPFPQYIAEGIKRRCEAEYGNCEFIVFES